MGKAHLTRRAGLYRSKASAFKHTFAALFLLHFARRRRVVGTPRACSSGRCEGNTHSKSYMTLYDFYGLIALTAQR